MCVWVRVCACVYVCVRACVRACVCVYIRDLTVNLLSEVYHSVSTEPYLQPISGETLTGASANVEDGARLDILANGFCGSRFERAFFAVWVFNPHAPSNRQLQLATTYRRHENLKKRCYEQRYVKWNTDPSPHWSSRP